VAPMGESNVYPTKLQCYVLLSWLAKDFAWVLLLPRLGFAAALLAVVLEYYSVRLAWQWSTWSERAPGIACVFWLTGNAIWMASEFLWDDEDGKHWFSWQSVPLATPDQNLKMAGTHVAVCFFVAGLASFSLMLLDVGQQMASIGNPQEENQKGKTEELVWGFVPPGAYRELFIAPWILKDLFWAMKSIAPAMFAAVAAALLILDSYRRFGSLLCIVEVIWVIANTIQCWGELREDGSSSIRLISSGCIVLGAVATLLILTICTQSHTGRADSTRDQLSTEESRLTSRKSDYSSTQ